MKSSDDTPPEAGRATCSMTESLPATPHATEPRAKSFNARFDRALSRLLVKLHLDDVPHIRRIIVTVVGGTIVICGLLMIVTPGPAILVIPVGLAVLGTEYAWARLWLRKSKVIAKKAVARTQKVFTSKEKTEAGE